MNTVRPRVLFLRLVAVACLLASAAGLSFAQTRPLAPPVPEAVLCPPGSPACARYTRQLTYPAHALARGAGAEFALHPRGVNWLQPMGTMSLTVRRPKDYAGGRVRVTLFYQVVTDEPGTLGFHLTPMTFNSGNNFETYGAIGTGTQPAPETVGTLLSSSTTIQPDNGWADGAWWYIEVQRIGTGQGGFAGALRMMSVSLEY